MPAEKILVMKNQKMMMNVLSDRVLERSVECRSTLRDTGYRVLSTLVMRVRRVLCADITVLAFHSPF